MDKEPEKQVELPKRNEPIEVVKLDEIYVGRKNCRRIWIAVDRSGKRFVSFVCGDRFTQTGIKLWDKINDLNVRYFSSDHWKSYEGFIPA